MDIPRLLSRITRGFVLGLALYGATVALQYWWFTSEFGPVRRARTERQECARGVSIPYQERDQNQKLSRFFEFAGVSPTSTHEDVQRLYGTPESEDLYLERSTYLNDAVEIEFSSGTVSAVELRNRFALLGGTGIAEPLAVFLGRSASAVLEEFGLPHHVSPGHFVYKFSGPEGTGTVEFECYDFRDCVCTEISVRW